MVGLAAIWAKAERVRGGPGDRQWRQLDRSGIQPAPGQTGHCAGDDPLPPAAAAR